MRQVNIKTLIFCIVCLVLSGCEAFKEDPNMIPALEPAKVIGGPANLMKGKKQDIECSAIAWFIDHKFDEALAHYDKLLTARGYTKSGKKGRYFFRNDIVEVMLLSKNGGGTAELRVARILNDKEMPKKKGLLTSGI